MYPMGLYLQERQYRLVGFLAHKQVFIKFAAIIEALSLFVFAIGLDLLDS